MAESDFKRTLYMCAYPPSRGSGGAIILRNLFRDFPADRLWMLVSKRHLALDGAAGGLLAATYATAPWPEVSGRVIWRLGFVVRMTLIPLIVAKAVRMVRRHRIEVIFAVQFYGEFYIAAYLAHLITGRPLYTYSMDEWLSNVQTHSRLLGWLAAWLEPRILRSASRRWVISDAMADDRQRRYGVDSDVLRHSVDIGAFARASAANPDHPPGNDLVIVNMGTIYSVNVDPFGDLLTAVRDIASDPSTPQFRVRLYTSQPLVGLAALGIQEGDLLEIGSASEHEVPQVLARGDILFLPLSFEPRWRRVVRDAFPTKLAEYLASGRSVLVYAPDYSTAARYVRQHECGLVVDTPDPEALSRALLDLAKEETLRKRLSAIGQRVALRNHDRTSVVGRFLDAFRATNDPRASLSVGTEG